LGTGLLVQAASRKIPEMRMRVEQIFFIVVIFCCDII